MSRIREIQKKKKIKKVKNNMKRVSSFANQKGILYVVSTPIGNKKEFSLRAQEVISSCDFVASEDTRTTGLLLSEFGIKKPMISCHEHNEKEASMKIIELLKDGKKIALTSDAGYPGISDPGEKLIKLVIENDIPVSIIHGSSAFLGGLLGSSLSTSKFYFHGFLNAKSSSRKKELEEIKSYPMTLIFYESPHRIMETLNDIYEIFGERNLTIARELTKIHEEYIYTSTSESLTLDSSTLKGEMVIIVEGCRKMEKIDEKSLKELLKSRLKDKTVSKKALAKEIAEIYNYRTNEIYEMIIKLDQKD